MKTMKLLVENVGRKQNVARLSRETRPKISRLLVTVTNNVGKHQSSIIYYSFCAEFWIWVEVFPMFLVNLLKTLAHELDYVSCEKVNLLKRDLLSLFWVNFRLMYNTPLNLSLHSTSFEISWRLEHFFFFQKSINHRFWREWFSGWSSWNGAFTWALQNECDYIDFVVIVAQVYLFREVIELFGRDERGWKIRGD